MSTKKEVLDQVDPKLNYIGTKVKEIINSVHCEDTLKPPTKWKKGDVIRVRVNTSSNKTRPSVVVKVSDDYLISIPLTSSEDLNALCKSEGSRFFRDSFFCKTYVVTTIEYANENFIGVYENNKSINNAVKQLKIFINKNI
tara:strand:- start:552 stop:974 length:423 start_codon:yes stop_codon:yes gene_type:complete